MAEATDTRAWHEIVQDVLKRHKVESRDLRARQRAASADRAACMPTRTSPPSPVTREEEALGINAGAWMGGTRGILLMQTSGFRDVAERRSPRCRCRSRSPS